MEGREITAPKDAATPYYFYQLTARLGALAVWQVITARVNAAVAAVMVRDCAAVNSMFAGVITASGEGTAVDAVTTATVPAAPVRVRVSVPPLPPAAVIPTTEKSRPGLAMIAAEPLREPVQTMSKVEE